MSTIARRLLKENMFSAAFTFLIFACGFSLAANDPCLAPICVVNKPCTFALPPCVQLLETTLKRQWVRFAGNKVHGVPRSEDKFNLKKLLKANSCPITITVLKEEEANHFGDCDYKRSNDSLKAFNEIGKVYRVESREALDQVMNDAIPKSVGEDAITVTRTEPVAPPSPASAETTLPTTVAETATSDVTIDPKVPPTVGKEKTEPIEIESEKIQPPTSEPILEVGVILHDDDERPSGAQQSPNVEEITVGDLFQIALTEPSDSFQVLEVSPNMRVIIERNFAVGFTIFSDDPRENFEFRVSSSSGRAFLFKLQPKSREANSQLRPPASHRLVTEWRESSSDLEEALRQIREIADNQHVLILSVNSTHILWMSEKYIKQPPCASTQGSAEIKEMKNKGSVITRLEVQCAEEENSPFHKVIRIFLIPVLPLVLCIWLALCFIMSERSSSPLCGARNF